MRINRPKGGSFKQTAIILNIVSFVSFQDFREVWSFMDLVFLRDTSQSISEKQPLIKCLKFPGKLKVLQKYLRMLRIIGFLEDSKKINVKIGVEKDYSHPNVTMEILSALFFSKFSFFSIFMFL